MTGSIPSLSKLRALEAVSRYGSFTRAAAELNMTQAAVSYQVRMLEEELGVRLIDRTPKGVAATEFGRSFLSDVTEHLRALEAATTRVRQRNPAAGSLRVLVMQAFASLWLLPRLARFKAAYPKIEINVLSQIGGVSRVTESDFDSREMDVTIVYTNAAKDWRGVFAERLVDDFALPVCSPLIINPKNPIKRPDDLCRYTLLHAINWPGIWARWFAEAGAGAIAPAGEIHLQHTAMTVQAALAGMGVAMAHGPLVREELRMGRLVTAPDHVIAVAEGYYFACREEVANIGAVLSFRSWLRHEIEAAGALRSI